MFDTKMLPWLAAPLWWCTVAVMPLWKVVAVVDGSHVSTSRRIFPRFLPTGLATVVVVGVLLLPASQVPAVGGAQVAYSLGIFAHFVLFFVWALAFLYDFLPTSTSAKMYPFVVVPCALVFGLATEVLQDVTEMQRTFALQDVLTDLTGAFCAAVVVWVKRV